MSSNFVMPKQIISGAGALNDAKDVFKKAGKKALIVSGKVMEKCHMTYEGTLRQGGRNNQGIADLAVYSILREEYEALQNMKQEKRLEEQ